jgi:thiol-disulfide isomerase/thioredoxin
MLKRLLLSLGLAAAALLFAGCSRTMAGSSLGPAPAWNLKDPDGHPVSSDQFKGKVVVFDFWATWCGPCRSEIPGYVDLQKKYGGAGLVIIGAAVQEPSAEEVKKFVRQYGVSYQIVMADDAIQTAFGGIDAIPTTYLIDRDGNIRDKKVGAVETAEYEKRVQAVLQN